MIHTFWEAQNSKFKILVNYTKLCKGNCKTTFKKHYENHKKSFYVKGKKMTLDSPLNIGSLIKLRRPWKNMCWKEWWWKLINFVIKYCHPFVDSVKNNRYSIQISKSISSSRELCDATKNNSFQLPKLIIVITKLVIFVISDQWGNFSLILWFLSETISILCSLKLLADP